MYGYVYLCEGDTILRCDLLKELGLPLGVDNITNELPGELCAVIAYSELFSTESEIMKRQWRRKGNHTVLA